MTGLASGFMQPRSRPKGETMRVRMAAHMPSTLVEVT
jgi:hypothetical protein